MSVGVWPGMSNEDLKEQAEIALETFSEFSVIFKPLCARLLDRVEELERELEGKGE